MKVLLLSANTVRVPYYIYPLGLDYVAGALEPRHAVKIADINTMNPMEPLFELIRDFSPEVIGISLRNIDNTDAHESKSFILRYRELIDAIRSHSPAPIVLGGSGFTIFPKRLMDALQADYGIIGEGERMAALVDALETGSDPAALPGVITASSSEGFPPPLESHGTRKFTGESHAQFYISRGGMLNLQTKRGCTYNCIYCTYPHIEGTSLRPVPPDEVARYAIELQNAGARYFFITDSVFNTSYEHSAAVADAFVRRRLAIPWGGFFAPTRPPADYYRGLHDAGLTHVEFGTESLSAPMLRTYRKPFSVEDVFAAHESALAAGLHAAHYFLLGGPGENEDTLRETLRNADRLGKTVLFFFCGIRIYPHTEIYDIALREGQISESDDLLEPVFYRSGAIGGDEIFRIVREHARGRENWLIGSTDAAIVRVMSRLYRRGHTGPLWEMLIR